MKLYYSETSPYARKVRLLLREKKLLDEVEEVAINPFDDRAELQLLNPLGKIPLLVIGDGRNLYDSPLICEFLDSASSHCPLIPEAGWQRWSVLRWQALADGLMDAAYNLVMERRRPAEERSAAWIHNWSNDIQQALSSMESSVEQLSADLSLAQLAVGAALGYLDFRLSELLYDSTCPQAARFPALVNWYQSFATRPSMLATRHC